MNIDDFLTESKGRSGQSFVVRQGRYDGPYTQLLEMIESRKLSISEISLSKIADEYISYIKSLDSINPLDMSQFVQVAATLMLIKAKSLLPTIEYTKEEVEQVDSLTKKLEILSELKKANENIKNIFAKNILFAREKTPIRISIENMTLKEKPKSLTKENVYAVAVLTLAKMPNFERLKQVAVRQAIRMEMVVERIMQHISVGMSSLKSFAKSLGSDTGDSSEEQKRFKKNIIVSFLAILELLKTGVIDAFEKDGDIEIIRKEI